MRENYLKQSINIDFRTLKIFMQVNQTCINKLCIQNVYKFNL